MVLGWLCLNRLTVKIFLNAGLRGPAFLFLLLPSISHIAVRLLLLMPHEAFAEYINTG